VTPKAHSPGDLVGGRYEIRATVGRRPLGMMYRALDRDVDVEVALRVLSVELLPDEASRQAFAQKIGRARGLQHPNLMRFHGVAVENDEVAVAVQWAPGAPLAESIRGQGMDPSLARPILQQVAAGMHHAHSQGLVLGDVRPETVIVYADGIKLSNIGIGLALPRRTFLEAMQATPAHAYLAPELRAGRIAEPRADVFSLAALTVELLAGQALLPGQRISLQTLSQLPPALGPALSRALADDPMVRQPTVEALGREIEVILSTGAPPRPRRQTLPPVGETEGTEPDAKPRGFAQLLAADNETRQVSEDELLQIKGHELTRKVSEDELLPLRVASSTDDDPILEMEASFEGETTLDGEEEHEHDTEKVRLLEADAIKTEPVPKVEPEDDEDDKETIRVEKLEPEEAHPGNGVVSSVAPPTPQPPPPRPPPPPPVEQVAQSRPPPAVEHLPKIQVVELPVLRASPPRGTPIPPAPLPPPAPPARAPTPPQGARVPTPPHGVRKPTPARGNPTMEVVPIASQPPARRARKGAIAGVIVIVAFAAVLAAVVLSITDHLRELKLTQERAAKQRLADELNARADAMRRASTQPPAAPAARKAPEAPAPSALPALVPVAAPFNNRCPLGANLVDGPHRYCVDLYEYPGGRTIPRTDITFEDAGRLCASRGERLCTADEWEHACRGKSGASYPYGQSFDPTRCNTRGSGGEVAPAGSFNACRSASGAYDMSGNVAEWVIAGHGPAQKGGSVLSTNPQTRCSNLVRNGEPGIFVGFRCCADPR
jgi:eukaryotic-like serine/threonine-protein kinase